MRFYCRKSIKPENLSVKSNLFDGAFFGCINATQGPYAMTRLDIKGVVIKYVSEIDLIKTCKQGNFIEIRLERRKIGFSSFSYSSFERNLHNLKLTK